MECVIACVRVCTHMLTLRYFVRLEVSKERAAEMCSSEVVVNVRNATMQVYTNSRSPPSV